MSGFKYHIVLPLAVGVVVVGIPYTISLFVQWKHGWPSKRGFKKYIEALRPGRAYGLTGVALEILKCLRFVGLNAQCKSWYENAENGRHFEKGITFGRRGNKLDLYHPPTSVNPDGPLVVFIYGGSWNSGERSTYCLLAKQMSEELSATVVCPDYRSYPEGNLLGMVQDVADCLVWTQECGPSFNFDKDNILLMGHSAGGHLCALTTLFLIDENEELLIETSKQRDITQAIKGVFGLSGVYNITDHYEHQKKRGVEYVSAMHKATNGVENFPYYSPSHLLRTFDQDKLNRVPPFTLLHGTNDNIVPVESSTRFTELLTALSVGVSLYLLPNADHNQIVNDIMSPDRHFYHSIYSCIKHECRKIMTTHEHDDRFN